LSRLRADAGGLPRRLLSASVCLLSFHAAADEAPGPPPGDVDDRLRFIERSLDENRDAVRLWQTGWSLVYGTAAAGYLGLAIDADASDDRALHLVGALRAASAYALLQRRPHPGRDGAEPLRDTEFSSDESRLAATEALFAASARRAASRGRPARHLRNVALNAGFGLLVWAFGDSDDVLPFTLMGIAGGEAVLLSLPSGSRSDYEAYGRRHASAARDRRRWRLVAVPGGIGFRAPVPF
jgi:hypothetical protein